MKCLDDNETCIHVYVLYNTHIHVHIEMIARYNFKHTICINIKHFKIVSDHKLFYNVSTRTQYLLEILSHMALKRNVGINIGVYDNGTLDNS